MLSIKSLMLAAAGLFTTYATAQITVASSNPFAIPTPTPSTARLENLVSYLLPGASITSLSPSQVSFQSEAAAELISPQSTEISRGAQSFLSSYTQAFPISSLGVNIFLNQIGATTTPSPAQQSSLQALLNNAESGILVDPSGFVASISNLVAPFPFATQIYSYQNGIVNGLRTVVAADVGVSVPNPTRTSTAAAPRATQVVAGAVAMAAGLVGVALL